MASFEAETGRDRQRAIPKKKKLSFRSIPTRFGIKNSKKIAKKCKNLKKHDYGFISSQNGTGQAENDTKKKKCYRSNPFKPNTEKGIPEK